MKFRRHVALLLFLAACAGTAPRVLDVTELAPPQQVRFERTGEGVVIRWKPSPHHDRAAFAGYNVYVSQRSLIFAEIAKLPEPVRVGKDSTQVLLRDLSKSATYFVHVRSRTREGDLSLPSLPELVIRPPAAD